MTGDNNIDNYLMKNNIFIIEIYLNIFNRIQYNKTNIALYWTLILLLLYVILTFMKIFDMRNLFTLIH